MQQLEGFHPVFTGHTPQLGDLAGIQSEFGLTIH